MADLIIRDDLAEKLRSIAQRENRPVEEVIETLLEQYVPSGQETQLAEGDEEAIKQLKQKLYAIAREYWRKSGNKERLALTDAELDEQFWLIDHEGIPRLKSEEGTITLPPDPLEAIDGLFESDLTDMSTTVRETLAEYYRKRYGDTD